MSELHNENINNDIEPNTAENHSEEIKHDFEQAASDLGLDNPVNNAGTQQQEQTTPIEAQVAIGKQMIGGGLVLGLNTVGGLNVSTEPCEQFAEDIAACICKRYPGGLFAFMEQYKEELAMLYSGSMLFMAIKAAIREKAANDAQANDQEASQDVA